MKPGIKSCGSSMACCGDVNGGYSALPPAQMAVNLSGWGAVPEGILNGGLNDVAGPRLWLDGRRHGF